MRPTLCLLLLCVLVSGCWAPNYYRGRSRSLHKQYDRYASKIRRSNTVGLTWDGRPCPVMGGCIQLPRTRDLLTREEFITQVVGVNYQIVYQIGKGLTMPLWFREENRFTIQGENVFGDFSANFNGTCLYFPGFEYGTFNSTRYAVIYNPGTSFIEPIGAITPTFFIMSEDPTRYFIQLVCLDSDDSIINGYCNGRYFVNIALTQNPPNNPPYYEIEVELRKKLGLQLSDPGNRLLYIGEAC